MAARHYGQFLDASDPDQSADDDWRISTAPPEVLRGSFRIGYIPRDDSSYGSTRYLLSVQTVGDHLAFVVEPSGGAAAVVVYVDGALHAMLGPVTFAAGQELTITFVGPDGTITVSGATTGDSTVDGAAWNVVGSALRLGGNIVGAELARGYVSLPYAVLGAVLPDAALLNPGILDFSQASNSGYVSLF